MSERSFGDYTNRNVVKNPLLSTAVTGLSIEDLTQNAVLLPAVPSQELITRQDEQNGTQMRSLWHSEHDIATLSSGDTNSNRTQQHNAPTNVMYPINNNKNTRNDKTNEMHTESKASVKSPDDFDVNEYFARLQGTRYVSAPLNSNVTDPNANLQVEENLEEINLNDPIEPDKEHGAEYIQQSITADIAQNFSQLPNVLPHVASAVFSSFSNMLSLKSREVTPYEQKMQHAGQHEAAAVGIPLGVPEAPVSVAPPPLREPPMTGTTSNYRITTKKKVYAQVPGLSSGGNQLMQKLNPLPSSQNPPYYFTPDANTSSVPYDENKTKNVSIGYDMKSVLTDSTSIATDEYDKGVFYKSPHIIAEKSDDKLNMINTKTSTAAPFSTDKTIFDTGKSDQTNTETVYVSTQITPEEAKDRSNIFNPTALVSTEQTVESRANLQCSTIPDFAINQPGERQIHANNVQLEQHSFPSQPSIYSGWFVPVNDSGLVGIPPQGSMTVIPPPPMFSNIPRRDSQTTVGKSVLPPSVARRISANQPIIKPQAVPMMVPQDNIFIPTVPFEPETHLRQNFASSEYAYNLPDQAGPQNTGQHVTTDKSECIRQQQINQQTQPLPSANNPPSSFQKPLHSLNESVDSFLRNNAVPLMSSSNTMIPGLPSFAPVGTGGYTTQLFALPHQGLPIEIYEVCDTGIKSEAYATPSFFQERSNKRSPKTTDTTQQLRDEYVAPSMFFDPAMLTQATTPKASEEIQLNNAVTQDTFPQLIAKSPPEVPKEIPEPPKVTGNHNYRLTKKKPQYYSGPIDGVGNISNNIKPILNPIGPSLFQSAIFTPEKNVESTNQKLTTDYNVPTAHEIARPFDLPKPPTGLGSFQGAYFTPDQNFQPLNQKISSDYSLPSAYEVAPSFGFNQSTATSNPFDINEPEERKPPGFNDFNTAFDLSRPTSERFEDTSQESKGFGIIGSLKSKLSSIDINKIQNTVTTFFDPAYNDTKFEEQKQEHLSHNENYLSIGNHQNFPQTENASLEVYTPSINYEPVNANVYNNYPDSSQPTMQPQYYQTHEYLNQAQGHPKINYTGWDNMYNQLPSSGTINIFPNQTDVTQDSHHRNMTITLIGVKKVDPNNEIFFQDPMTASEKPLKEIENEKIANLSKLTESIPLDTSVHKELTLSETNNEIDTEKLYTLRDSKDETKISQNTADTSFKSFFDYSKDEPHSLLETNINNANSEYGPSVTDSLTSVFDIKQPVTYPIMQSKADDHLSQLKITKNVIEESPQTSRVLSNISAKDFFDRQQSQDNLTTGKLQKSIEEKTEHKPHSALQKSSEISSKSYFDYQFTNLDSGITNNKGLRSIFSKDNTTDIDTSKEILTTVVLPVLKNISDDLVPPQYLDNSTKDQQLISSTSIDNQIDEKATNLNHNAYTLFDFGQEDNTSISPGCAPYKDINDIEEKLENISLIENFKNISKQESSVSGGFAKSEPNVSNKRLLDHPVSDLNICETCREVNKPEDKDGDDLTTHLIENITAPIQLANPVDYAAVESSLVTDKSEISCMTEDITDTIKLPPVIELIDDIIIPSGINYGWSTNEPHACNVLQDHNQGFQPDPLSLGFFEDKSLLFENIPTNASDEIKAEYRISQEDIAVLPQINMPTAPPEEDTKSDESGLDVHSIEQDAKKDFPIYEEFVIDPSETDDNKIEYKERERSSDDPIPDADTFTNRVERYKKMETNPEPSEHLFELKRDSIPFELPTSTSPALTIASYFDTGNYAVENHYRNSLTSPSTLSSFTVNSTTPMRIPPGFEEEYKRRLSIAASSILPAFPNQNITYIPDTSTQTPSIITLTVNSNKSYVPDTSTQVRGLATLAYSESPIENFNISDAEVKTMVEKISSATNERLPAFSNFVEPKEETVSEQIDKASIEKEPQELEKPKLEIQTDPINFFSSNVESNADSDAYSNNSRLSSYFSSPPKHDHTKSFFELSQSQDHYRHKTKNDTYDSIQNNVQNFFKTTAFNTPTNASIVDTNNRTSNIPQNYIENMSLVNDLASCKNFKPTDDVVRTVNYFTIHNAENAAENSIGEPKVPTHLSNKILVQQAYNKEPKNNQLGDVDDNNLNFEDIIKNCKYCCDTAKKLTKVDIDSCQVRKSMDRNTDTKKEGDCNMDERKDTLSKKGISVNFADQTFQEDSSDRIISITENRTSPDYAPVKYHWFYRVDFEEKSIWRGFSAGDSKALEDAYNSPDLNENTIVATDGGRFDVNIMGRTRTAVYWADKPSNVMRCSWFYKGTAVPRYVPYTESVAEKLEEMYRNSVTTGEWHRRLMLPNEEMVVMHGPAVMVHFLQTTTDTFTSTPLFVFGKSVYRNPPKINVSEDQPQKIDHLIFMVHGAGEWRHQKEKISMRQRVVRGCVDSEIEDTEPSSIDHLLLMCHGVGSACDMRFRSVEEVVDDFRSTSLQLVQAHYKNSYDSGLVGRVEVLPISWHSSLHSGETGVDTRLAAVTLESIPRLRNFTNDTLLDVLFYTSPVFCQTIIDTVCGELNRIYALFKQRNPNYEGGVSLGGHSLGSVILYDLLCHQTTKDAGRQVSSDKQYVTGTAGTGQPCVKFPHLNFDPDALYALGSPIAIFECIRGVHTLGLDFCLPTCKNFFNIFHPYDPIAYRLEPMVNPHLRDVKPYLIPHHKGRKRMHLELKDTMARVGADIKQKLIESIKSTWSSMWKTQPPPDTQLEKVVEEEMEKEQLNAECKEDQIQERDITSDMLGKLNDGRRIDHVLQEAPFEMINEYLFAMSSHVCYWESEDTMLVMLREIYNAIGVIPDCSVPQHTLTVQRSRIQEDSVSDTYPVTITELENNPLRGRFSSC